MLEDRRVLAAGDLDLTFGLDGIATSPFAADSLIDGFYAIAQQPDGRTVAVGSATNGSNRLFPDLAIARFNSDGSLDSTFGSSGTVLADLGGAQISKETGLAVAIDPSSRILVGGWADQGQGKDFLLARYTTDGQIDPTFNASGNVAGVVVTDLGSSFDEARGLVVQSDGKIVLSGRGGTGTVAVARYLDDGTLDPSFDADGIVTTQIGSNAVGQAVTQQDDGKLVVAAENGEDAFLLRYNADGTLDPNFGVGGIVPLDSGTRFDKATDLAVQDDDRILVSGQFNNEAVLFRVLPDGALDTSFSSDGIAVVNLPNGVRTVSKLALQDDGRIVAIVSWSGDFSAVRLQSDGTLDTTFGSGGSVSVDLANSTDTARDVLIDDSGSVLVAGERNTGLHRDSALVRLASDGTLDSTFGSNGKTTVDFRAISDSPVATSVLLPDGSTIVVGSTSIAGTGSEIALAKFDQDGNVDFSFGDQGQVITAVNPNGNKGLAVAVQGDGKILVGGRTLPPGLLVSNSVLIRYHADGTLDSTFADNGILEANLGFQDSIHELAVLPDGKILAVGEDSNVIAGMRQILLAQFHSDGSLDAGFGTNGKVLVPSTVATPVGLALQSDGKFLVAQQDATAEFVVSRFEADGSFDTSFGDQGVATFLAPSFADSPRDLKLLADGRILVVGARRQGFSGDDLMLVRFHADGEVDRTFGTDGVTVQDFSANEVGDVVTLQPDGKILVGGTSASDVFDSDFLVARFLADGSPDINFGFGGRVVTDIGGDTDTLTGLTVLSDGRVQATGDGTVGVFPRDELQFAVVRYQGDANCGPEGCAEFTQFDYRVEESDGVATVTVQRQPGAVGSVTVDFVASSGTAIEGEDFPATAGTLTFAAGVTSASFDIPLETMDFAEGDETIRVSLANPTGGLVLGDLDEAIVTILKQGGNDGAIDAAFGGQGTGQLQLTLGGPEEFIHDMLALPDGRILAVGGNGIPGDDDFILMRLTSDGVLDPTFGTGGTINIDFFESGDTVYTLARTADGKIIVGGETLQGNAGSLEFAMARFSEDGEFDRTFGNEGRVVLQPADQGSSVIYSIIPLPDGKFLATGEIGGVGGPFGGGVGAIRFNENGSIDTSFGQNGIALNGQIESPFFRGRSGVTMLSDGSLIGFGVQENATRDDVFALTRFTPSGQIDTSFGVDGIVTVAIDPERDHAPYRILATPEDKVLIVGTHGFFGDEKDFNILRFNTDGTLDTTFGGGDGIVLIDFAGDEDVAVDAVLQRDGKLVVFGRAEVSGAELAAVARLNTDGSLDTSFGVNGKAVMDVGPFDFDPEGAVVLTPANRIVFGTQGRRDRDSFDYNYAFGSFFGPPSPGQFRFSADNYEVDENRGHLTVSIERVFGADSEATVRLRTSDGTASAGEDYGALDQVLTFQPGQVTLNVFIPVDDDPRLEGPETFTLSLSDPTGGAELSEPIVATGTIFDGPGQFRFLQQIVPVNESRESVQVFLERFGGTDGAVTVDFATSDLTAFAGLDYNAVNGTVSFRDGQSVSSFLFSPINDELLEGFERVQLTLSNPTGGAALSTIPQAELRIFDDEPNLGVTAGSLDPTYFEQGFNRMELGIDVHVRDMVQQSDGKYIVAGDAASDPDTSFIARFNVDGTPDVSFGETGFVLTSLGPDSSLQAIDLLSDGRMVVGGFAVFEGYAKGVAAVFHSDGSLDTSFADEGIRIEDLGIDTRFLGLTVQPDDRIVFVGSTGDALFRDYLVVRLHPDGTRDTNFSSDGSLTTDFDDRFDVAADVAVQDDGRIVVVGTTGSVPIERGGLLIGGLTFGPTGDFGIVRYNPDGTVDPTFGDAGLQTINFSNAPDGIANDHDQPHTVLIQDDGDILIGGRTDESFLVARLDPDGSLDSDFGQGRGFVSDSFIRGIFVGGDSNDVALTMAFQSDGKLLVGVNSESHLGVARLDDEGRFDFTFGASGLARTENLGAPLGIFPQPDGKIITVGGDRQGGIAIARLMGESACPAQGCIGFQKFSVNADEDRFNPFATVVVTRPQAASFGEVSVDYFTVDGTARAGVDYEFASGTLTFGDGETTKTLAIPVIPDTLKEPGEQFFVVLGAPTGGAVLASQAISPVVIDISDIFEFENRFILQDVTVSEGGKAIFVTVRRSRTLGDASVDFFTRDLTATAGRDYLPTSGTLHFAHGERSKAVRIELLADRLVESSERFDLVLTNPRGSTTFASAALQVDGTITITDSDPSQCDEVQHLDDSFGTDGLVTTDVAGLMNLDLVTDVVRLPDGRAILAGRTQVPRNNAAGLVPDIRSAIAAYLPDGSLDTSFGEGGFVLSEAEGPTEQWQGIQVLSDGKLLLFGVSNGRSDGAGKAYVIARFLPDGSPDTSFGTGGKVETLVAAAQVSLDSLVFQPDGKIVAAGRSFNGFDFDYLLIRFDSDGTVDRTFGRNGQFILDEPRFFNSFDQLFLLSNGKLLVREGVTFWQFNADGTVDAGFGSEGRLDVVHPDGQFFIVDSLLELPNGQFLVQSGSRLARLNADFSFDLTFGDAGRTVLSFDDEFGGTTIFGASVATAPNGQIVVGGSSTSGGFGVARLDADGQIDTHFGNNGRLSTVLPTGGGSAREVFVFPDGRILAAGTAGDDFALVQYQDVVTPGSFRFRHGEVRVAEDAGSLELEVQRICGSEGVVSVRAQTRDETATDGLDYTGFDQVLTFGDSQLTRTITIPIADNLVADGDLVFDVILSNPTNGTTLNVFADMEVTIVDDDKPGTFQFSELNYETDEGSGEVTVTVERVDGDRGTISVDYEALANSAEDGVDFTATSGTLTFANGETSQTFVVAILEDSEVDGPKSVRLELSNPTGNADLNNQASAFISIADNDVQTSAAGTIDFSAGEYRVTEDTREMQVTLLRRGGSDGEATIGFSIHPGTAGERDFIAYSGVLTFADGETIQSFVVPILEDTLVETDETVFLELHATADGSPGETDSATLTIEDNDIATDFPVITVNDVLVDETDTGTTTANFVVKLSTGFGVPVRVNFATSDGSARAGEDYVAQTGTIDFAPGESSQTVSVEVRGDFAFEGDETFVLTLSDPTAGALLGDAQATGTIRNDDLASTVVGIAAADADKPEGDSGGTSFHFNVNRSGDISGTSVVAFSVQGNGADPADANDFGGALPSGSVTFGPNETSKTITVSVTGDATVEGDEEFLVLLADAVGAAIRTDRAKGTIRNDDSAPLPTTIGIQAVDSEKLEGDDGLTPFTFTVSRGGNLASTTTVQFQVQGSGSPSADAGDFGGTFPSGTVSFGANESSKQVTINVTGDTTIESDEEFRVTLSSAVGGTISTSFASAVILNDDRPPTADLSLTKTVDDPTTEVGQDAVFTITVSNQGPDAATGVRVTDLLPAGLTLVSFTTSQGDYNSATGLWEVGSVVKDGSATLHVTATVEIDRTLANRAEIVASDQFDPDSTPGNSAVGEDDLATAEIGRCLTGGPLHIGMNRLVFSCAGAGMPTAFVVGTEEGTSELAPYGVEVAMADPQVHAIGIANESGVSVVFVDISAPLAGQSLIFQAFQMFSTDPDPTSNVLVLDVPEGPLRALSGEGPGAQAVSRGVLDPLVAEAMKRWKAKPLTLNQREALEKATIHVTNLPADLLGTTYGRTVVIDATAAGHGWFIDATADLDEEFLATSHEDRLQAVAGSGADGRMDLLTVIMHELGHVIGLKDQDDDHGLMHATLDTSTRRIPDSTPDRPHRLLHNAALPFDINSDGDVSPWDVAALAAFLISQGPQTVPQILLNAASPPMLDVNGDDRVDVQDVAAVVSRILIDAPAEGEGERAELEPVAPSPLAGFEPFTFASAPFSWASLAREIGTSGSMGGARRDARDAGREPSSAGPVLTQPANRLPTGLVRQQVLAELEMDEDWLWDADWLDELAREIEHAGQASRGRRGQI